ncbi:MAG: LpxL/LpxP family Kdo(2)-lipid IV(A) lauroyl/palmitoleoyl acyltransferase [Vibrio sp.]
MNTQTETPESLVSLEPPKFSNNLLHPKYWGVWAGYGFVALLVNILPFCVILWLGRTLGWLGIYVAKRRFNIAKRNFELAFPDMGETERDYMARENMKNTGMGIFETMIAWFWPDWRIKRIVRYYNLDKLQEYENQGRGTLLCSPHNLNLELSARACALYSPGYGVYRPHDNPAFDFIQHYGRTRSGNIMVDRKDLKSMMKILRKGKKLFYLPDHDYGFKNAVFVPFFAVQEASTTVGTNFLTSTKCAVMAISCYRYGQYYEFRLGEDISDNCPIRDAEGVARRMNQEMEKTIMRSPTQWMWVHKRYKTMPDGKNKGIRYK